MCQLKHRMLESQGLGSNVLHFLGLVPGLEGGKICLRHRAML
jgi:hypothetical protein